MLKNTAFWSSSRANNFFSKNGLHHFLGEPSGYLHAKFQKNLPSGYRELLGTDGRTDGRTNERSLMHRTIFPHIFGRSKNPKISTTLSTTDSNWQKNKHQLSTTWGSDWEKINTIWASDLKRVVLIKQNTCIYITVC